MEEALRLHQERLGVFEELGNPEGIANALRSLGRLASFDGRMDDARGYLERAYVLLLKLHRLDGLCVVGLDLAPLLAAMGRVTEAKKHP